MGVYIFLDLMPNQIDEEDWKLVYEESLKLIRTYPFMDNFTDREAYDVPWIYVDRADETVFEYSSAEAQVGWHIIGDLESMLSAESVQLMKDLNYYRDNREDDPYDDIIAAQVFHEIDPDQEKYRSERIGKTTVFDGKTQGYPHHLYLLAIACLIESRFPKHAMVYGDISIAQMKKAVAWANTILDKPIDLPERCDNKKLVQRIQALVVEEEAVLQAFMGLTFYKNDMQLGDFVRNHFSKRAIKAYFTKSFSNYKPEQIGFRDELREYIDQGYSLEEACDICVLDPEGCHYDAKSFTETVMSLNWRHGGEEQEVVEADVNDAEPDTVSSQFGNVLKQMMGIQEVVQSKLTYKEVAAILEEKFGHPVEVKDARKEAADKEEEMKFLRKQLGLDRAEAEDEESNTYTINNLEELLTWRPGDTIHPDLEKSIKYVKEFIEKLFTDKKDYFIEFDLKKERDKINLLLKNNRYFYIRKSAWDEIIEKISDSQIANANLAILVIQADGKSTNQLCKALVNNQALLKEYIL